MPNPFRYRPSRYATPRPWQPLDDAEWAVLAPFLARATPGRGRPLLGGARARLDAVFRVVSQNLPWREAGWAGVAAGTVSRQFRRWAHAGLFAALLRAVARGRRAAVPRALAPVLRGLEHWICAAHRRSVRALGVPAIVLARRLGMLSALPGPPWMLPDPDLSALVMAEISARLRPAPGEAPTQPWEWQALRRVLRVARGRRIPRCLVPA